MVPTSEYGKRRCRKSKKGINGRKKAMASGETSTPEAIRGQATEGNLSNGKEARRATGSKGAVGRTSGGIQGGIEDLSQLIDQVTISIPKSMTQFFNEDCVDHIFSKIITILDETKDIHPVNIFIALSAVRHGIGIVIGKMAEEK